MLTDEAEKKKEGAERGYDIRNAKTHLIMFILNLT